MIFCGDLNSTPKTGVVEFMANGVVKATHKDWTAGIKEDNQFKGLDLHTSLRLQLASGFPDYTNYTMHTNEIGFAGCLDYIWTEKDKFTVESTLAMPAHELITKYQAIPSKICPSDHLPIICDISVVMNSDKQCSYI